MGATYFYTKEDNYSTRNICIGQSENKAKYIAQG